MRVGVLIFTRYEGQTLGRDRRIEARVYWQGAFCQHRTLIWCPRGAGDEEDPEEWGGYSHHRVETTAIEQAIEWFIDIGVWLDELVLASDGVRDRRVLMKRVEWW